MSENPLRIVATRDIPDNELVILRQDLSAFIPSEEPQRLVLLTAEPPQYLELIGRAIAWAPLAAYGVRLAQRMADTTWDNRKEILGWADARIKGLAEVILRFIRGHPQVKVGLGVEFWDPNWPAFFWLQSGDEAEVIRSLAVFLANAEAVESALRREVESGHPPLGGPVVSLVAPASLVVQWLDQDGKQHSITISREEPKSGDSHRDSGQGITGR